MDDAQADWRLRAYAEQLSTSAMSYFGAFKDTGESQDLDQSIALMSDAIAATPKGSPQELERLLIIAKMLDKRYEKRGEPVDLERLIETEDRATMLMPRGHPAFPLWISTLGSSHQSRFKQLGEMVYLDKAIEFMRLALELTPAGDKSMSARLNNLGYVLRCRFQRLGELVDLNRAIDYASYAVLLTQESHSDMPAYLNNLASMLQSRFKRLGELADLDKAIQYRRRVVALTPHDHLHIHIWLNNLASTLEVRFNQLGELADIDQAIEYNSQAVLLTPQGHTSMPTRLNNLGLSLQNRFTRLGKLEDLDKAIEHSSKAVTITPKGHSDMPIWLINLGTSLQSRFQRLGELADLNKSIDYISQAVSLLPEDHSDMPTYLHGLGCSLQIRFDELSELPDLDEAIKFQTQAVSLTPLGHTSMPSRLNSLGFSLEVRFQRLREPADLNKAIENINKAVSLTPLGHSDLPRYLNCLGCSLQTRFDQLGKLPDLDEAIIHQTRAVSLTPQGHTSMPAHLSNLGCSLNSRFERLGELTDLDGAIGHFSRAVALTPEDHTSMPTLLSNLGPSFMRRFERLEELADLNKAIDCTSQAVSLTPESHASLPIKLNNLGVAYECRFYRFCAVTDIENSLTCFQKAGVFPIGSPVYRFKAALHWAKLSLDHRSCSSLTAYQQVISLLPQLVWLGSTLGSRYRNVVDVGNVTTEATAVAISMQDFPMALEWLEQGRSIVWRQMLQLRTPLDELAAVDSELALQLHQVARDLDLASAPSSVDKALSSNGQSLEQAAQQHRRLAERWESLLVQARGKPGFEAFLGPMKASDLMRSAQSGPVVVINVDKSRCDALIILPGVGEITHVPLELCHEKVASTRVELDQFIRSPDLTQRKPNITNRRGKNAFARMLTMLWTKVVKPVLKALDYMRPPSSGNLPHITWCTTGLLSFLPLHAAGDYESGEMIFNYAISSYTPTLSALVASPPTKAFSGLLVVGQCSTLGLPPLPGTVDELNHIVKASQGHLVTRLDERLATPATVMAGMETHNWVHFACHALQDPANPLQSAFYLHDGTLDLATITQKQLKHADFAFLSACQTATGNESLPDEAVHLAAGMLMAGYKTVIATMWSIGDKDAPQVTEEVYHHLFEGGEPDARRAAIAVHKATERLREKVGVEAFAQWVPYIHIGL